MDSERRDQRPPLSEEYLRKYTVGELRPLSGLIRIVNYDPELPQMFERQVERIRSALGAAPCAVLKISNYILSGGGGCLNCSAASRAPGNQLRFGVLGKSNPILSTMLLQKVDDRSIGTTAWNSKAVHP